MGDLVRMNRSRDAKRAKDRIRQLWNDGSVAFAGHAMDRLGRRGLDANDIQHLIRYGRVTHGGPSGFPQTPKRFVLEGAAVDGDPMACVLDMNDLLVVVTAYPKD